MYSLLFLFMILQFYYLLLLIYRIVFPNQKTIYIMRGLPGSGKTTWIHNFMLTNNKPYYICSYKNFYNEKNPRDLPKSYNLCFKIFMEYLYQNKDNIFIDNPNIEKWEYINYVNLGKLYNYHIKIIEIECPGINYVGVFKDRCKNIITLKKMESLFQRWEYDNLAKIEEPYINFSDNGDSLPYPKKTICELDEELNKIYLSRKKNK